MLNKVTVEDRLVILEQTVSDLQRKIDASQPSPDWLDNLIGSISDESAFLESLEYGRAFRQSGDLNPGDTNAEIVDDRKSH